MPGEKISRLLFDRRWSQSELARRVGMRQNNLSYIITNGREPVAGTAIAIARALNVDPDWLWSDSDVWPPTAHAAASALSDAELLDELARRRELYLRDLRSVGAWLFDPKALAAAVDVAERVFRGQRRGPDLSDGAIQAISADVDRLWQFERMIQRLEAAYLSSPDRIAVQHVIGSQPALKRLYDWAATGQSNIKAYGPGESPGEAVPCWAPFGSVVTWSQFNAMEVFQQRRYVPIFPRLREAQPVERYLAIHRGTRAPENISEWVRFDTRAGRAFALRVEAGFPPETDEPGTIFVCDPDAAAADNQLCVMVCRDADRDGLYVVKNATATRIGRGGLVMPLDRLDALHRFPVVATLPPPPADAAATAGLSDTASALSAPADRTPPRRKPAAARRPTPRRTNRRGK